MEHKYKTMLNKYAIEIDIHHKNNLICNITMNVTSKM